MIMIFESERSALAYLGQIGSERVYDAIDEIANPNDRFDNRLAVNEPNFVDRHVKAETNFFIRLCINVADKKFFASFQREQVVDRAYEKRKLRNGGARHCLAD